jgi:integrase
LVQIITVPMSSNFYLNQFSIATSTNKKYTKALLHFIDYLSTRNYSLSYLSKKPRKLDRKLCEYIHYLHSEKPRSSPALAFEALHSLLRETGLSKSLFHLSETACIGWRRNYETNYVVPRKPLSLEIVTLISTVLAKSGEHGAAVATLLAFNCYLRISEFVGLTVSDIVFAGDARLGSGLNILASIRLTHVKTGAGKGQGVSITDSTMSSVLMSYIDHQKRQNNYLPSNRLFGMKHPNQYRALFHSAVDALGLSSVGYVPHSLRHGGATYDSMRSVGVKELMMRGRWKAQKSLSTYVQQGQLLLTDTHLSMELFQCAQLIGRHINTVLSICREMNQ